MNPVSFITGASSGIGYALALELAARGDHLALAARRKEALDDLAFKVQRRGGQALTLACDVRDAAQVKEAVAETLQHFGRIDLALLSAGISADTEAINFNAAAFAEMVETNLLGVAYCLDALLPAMRAQGGGTIAAISSLAGDRGIPGASGYCATKAALTTLFDGLRGQMRTAGIRLVTIAPGYVRTPMTARHRRMPFLMEADEAARLILRRIERGARVIRFPLVPSLFMGLLRVLPARLYDTLTNRQPIRRG